MIKPEINLCPVLLESNYIRSNAINNCFLSYFLKAGQDRNHATIILENGCVSFKKINQIPQHMY